MNFTCPIKAVVIFHCMLYLTESYLPLRQIAFSIICHSVYSLNLRTFPVISLTSVSFISSCVLAVLNHFVWFFHFNGLAQAARARESKWRYRHPTASKVDVPSFLDVSTFFVICVWLVSPFKVPLLGEKTDGGLRSHYSCFLALLQTKTLYQCLEVESKS